MFDCEKCLPCPLCGSKPKLKRIGNDHTKKRSIEIHCKGCNLKLKYSGLRYSHDQIEAWTLDQWNNRVPLDDELNRDKRLGGFV